MSGYVIGRATVDRVIVLLERDSGILLGDFVVLEDGELRAMGIVDYMQSGHRIVGESILSQEAIEQLAREREMGAYSIASIRILGILGERGLGGLPRRPISVLSRVRKAGHQEISSVLQGGHLEIGHVLSNPGVKVSIDVNRMVARHLAILSMTGGGKSNTVALLASEIGKMGGTVIILDFHNEYKVVGDRFDGALANVIEPKLNPRTLSVFTLMDMLGIRPDASVQRALFYALYFHFLEKEEKPLLEAIMEALDAMIKKKFGTEKGEKLPNDLDNIYNNFSTKTDAILSLRNKIEFFLKSHETILEERASRTIDMVQEGRVNVIKIGLLPDYMVDAFVAILLHDVLEARKAWRSGAGWGLRKPIFIVLEEAHILVGRKKNTMTKMVVARIAREGRKFGVGLALVSQRPSSMDQDVLSQMNSLIALRMISKQDKNAVAEASDQVDENMVESLSSLNPGEALLVGPFVPFPFFVKIKEASDLLSSSDPDVVSEWRGHKEGVKDDAVLIE